MGRHSAAGEPPAAPTRRADLGPVTDPILLEAVERELRARRAGLGRTSSPPAGSVRAASAVEARRGEEPARSSAQVHAVARPGSPLAPRSGRFEAAPRPRAASGGHVPGGEVPAVAGPRPATAPSIPRPVPSRPAADAPSPSTSAMPQGRNALSSTAFGLIVGGCTVLVVGAVALLPI